MGEKMSVMTVFNILLHLVHIIYTFVQKIRDVWSSLLRLRIFHLDECTDEFECVRTEIKKLEKIPRHLVLILGSEDPSYRDLARIVVWCVASGISVISFYDHNGILKKSKEKLYEEVTKSSLKYENGSWKRVNGHIPINGYKCSIRMNLFSWSDGRGAVVELARDLAARNFKSADLNCDIVDAKLSERFSGLPEPDLAICCGRVCGTYGLLPWHIRVTEFLNVQSHHKMSVNTFLSVLHVYGHCEQRYGK